MASNTTLRETTEQALQAFMKENDVDRHAAIEALLVVALELTGFLEIEDSDDIGSEEN